MCVTVQLGAERRFQGEEVYYTPDEVRRNLPRMLGCKHVETFEHGPLAATIFGPFRHADALF